MVTIASNIKLFTSFLFLFSTFFTFAFVPVKLALPVHVLLYLLVANETAHKFINPLFYVVPNSCKIL